MPKLDRASWTAQPASAQVVGFDIVYVRQARFGDLTNTTWPEVFHPAKIDPGADLMLLHPDGSEEILVAAGNGAVTDPFVSFDGAWIYYSFFPDVRPGAYNSQRDLPYQGADIYKMHLPTRRIVCLRWGMYSITPFTHGRDEAAPVGSGGCHAHSSQTLAFDQTVAGQPAFAPVDLVTQTPLLTQDALGQPSLRVEPTGVVDVEFHRDIRPLLQRSCAGCHTTAAAPGNLILDNTTLTGGLPRDYVVLADDANATGGYPPEKRCSVSLTRVVPAAPDSTRDHHGPHSRARRRTVAS